MAADVGTQIDPRILVVGPSALRTNDALCLLSFVRWTRRHLDAPPRVVLLASGPLASEFRAEGATVVGSTVSPLRMLERTLTRLDQPKPAKAVRLAHHTALIRRPPLAQVVYASTIHGAGPSLRHRPPGSRLVVHAYEPPDVLDELVKPPMMARLVAGTHAWIAASDEVRTGLVERGVDEARIARCDPFIDTPSFDRRRAERLRASLGLAPGTVVVGGLGRSDWRDGPDVFLRTASVIRRRWPDAPIHFVWVGAPDDGPTRWVLEHDIRHAGLEGCVTLTGDLVDTEAWVTVFDVLCLTTRVGPLPSTALLAGAHGVPVVAFEMSGMSHLRPDPAAGEDHSLEAVPYLDVEAMAAAVVGLVGDGDARHRSGELFRARVLTTRLAETGAPVIWEVLRSAARSGPLPGRHATLESVGAELDGRSG